MSKSYLTPNQVSELLMVSPTAVRQWAEKGDLNALTTPGGHRRFLPREVERFARERGLTLNIDNDDLRILVVDDDEQLGRYLSKLLDGFDDVVVNVVNDGFAAGIRVKEFEPYIVLLDLMMPGVNGFQVCKMLKNAPHTKNIRVIAMTGYPSDDNVKQIMAEGAEICLKKPIDEKLLLEHIGLTTEKNK